MTKLILLSSLALSTLALADAPKKTYGDPAVVAKDAYKLIMENDRVRVFDVKFKPGQKAEMHSHPDHVVYVFDDATMRLTGPDGKSQDVPLKAGMSVFLPAGPHAAENIGKTTAHNLVIELKAAK